MDRTDNQDDPPLDIDELRAVAVLTADDLGAIDRAILASSHTRWRKMSIVMGVAMDAYQDLYLDVPDVFYAQRVQALVSAGRLQAQGNPHRMRFGYIRLSEVP